MRPEFWLALYGLGAVITTLVFWTIDKNTLTGCSFGLGWPVVLVFLAIEGAARLWRRLVLFVVEHLWP